jgi:hypothetical protein
MIHKLFNKSLVQRLARRPYGTEAAEVVNAVKEGKLKGVPKDLMERCPVCSSMFHEMMEGRKVSEMPPGCAVQATWVKYWMENHDSMDLYSSKSLDGSGGTDDKKVQEMAEHTVVVSKNAEGERKMKCGLNCCQN